MKRTRTSRPHLKKRDHGIEAALASRPASVRRWLDRVLATREPLAAIRATLLTRHGIKISVAGLSKYTQRHCEAIFGPTARAQQFASVAGDTCKILISAPGATSIAVHLLPVVPVATAKRKAAR